MHNKTALKHKLKRRLLGLLLTLPMLISTCGFGAFAAEAAPEEPLQLIPEITADEIASEKEYLVHYSDAVSLAEAGSAELGETGEAARWDCLDGAALTAALADGLVDYYEEDYPVYLLSDPQWEHETVHAEAVQTLGADGAGLTIGVIDSGIYPHSEYADRLIPGHNYLEDSEDTSDSYGHGTKVAGVIAAACDDVGSSGIAPDAQLVPLKCFDAQRSSISSLIGAIYDAVDKYHCDILNMSFGTTKESAALKTAIDYAADSGMILVAAVGNSGSEALQYPAAFDSVIGVGSVNPDGSHTASSQRNESVYLSAPGVMLFTTSNDGSYCTASGTSFAAPLVSGAIADLLTIDPTLTADDLRTLLADTAADAGDPGYDALFGWGVLDLQEARAALLGDASLYLTPMTLQDTTLQGTALRLSGDLTACTLVTTVTDSSGSLLAAGTTDCTMDDSGALAYSLELPTAIDSSSLLPENLVPLAARSVVQEDGSTITVTAVETGTCFRDVRKGAYWFAAVHWSAQQGIVYGTGDRLFEPGTTCSRAHIVTFLWRMAGRPEPEAAENPFTDIPAGSYYEKAVLWAVENGITYGTAATKFSPDAACTRAQIVAFLWRYAGRPACELTDTPFTDIPEGAYYRTAVAWAVENGITYGTDSTHFSPEQPCTRGQAVSLLYRSAAAEG